MLKLFAGVDAGGSSSRVALASADGSVASWGKAVGANPNHVGWEGAQKSIGQALDIAVGQWPREALCGVFLGMAGVISKEDRKRAVSMARAWSLAPRCEVDADHDIRIALEGGLGGGPGIALIAGTGSSCYGRNERGESWQAGGWEAVLDDLGSGYDLARRGMAVAAQCADGRLSGSLLEEIFFEALKVKTMIEFCARVHRPAMERHEIAALAPLVLSAAEQGDAEALRIVQVAAAELARMVRAVAGRCFVNEPVDIVCIGGLLEKAPHYREQVKRAVLDAVPDACVRDRLHSPAVGALLLAARQGGVALPESTLNQLSRIEHEL